MADIDVVVVGGGFAGLTAARRLHQAGREVLLFEARDRIGGRTHTTTRHDTAVDLGGQWVGPGQERIQALLTELGCTTWPQPEAGDDVLVETGGVRRVDDVALGFSTEELTEYIELVGAFEEIAGAVPLDAPWAASGAADWDAQTLASWVRAQGVQGRAQELFEVGVQAVFAASSGQLSLLHAAHYTQAAGGWTALTSVSGGAQQDRVSGGLQPVAEALATSLGHRVRLEAPVRRIVQDHSGVVVSADGLGEVRARRVVVALPPTLAGRLDYEPALPADRDQLTQRMPHGSVIKFHVFYQRPWWRDDGLSGTLLSTDGPIGVTFDGTPPAGEPGVITGFFEGPHAVEASRRTQQERQQVVTDLLVRGLGEPAASPLDYVDLDWSAEPWTRGCYGAHLPPGVWTQFGPALRAPVGRIHWAGTETAGRWPGYIDGAIESGERVAAELLDSE